MHKNTYLLVGILAIIAALVVGVNIGKKISPNQSTTVPQANITPTVTLEKKQLYTNNYCGFSLQYPDHFTKLENATGSAILSNPKDSNDSIIITCQKDIPRSPLTPDKIETIKLTDENNTASADAKLYHDASQKDGSAVDSLIFRHPSNGMDIFIAGYSTTYNEVIKTIKLIP